VVIIGCGDYQPIKTYLSTTASIYPIYANPSNGIYRQFGFSSSLGRSKPGEEKEYEKELGGAAKRVWDALMDGPVKHFEHVSTVGPKSLNGGEVVLEEGKVSVKRGAEKTLMWDF
jgi:hypothetical protein